jgi:hypothetical protein
VSWIVVRNWDKFQHYKDRDPAWIKLYMELRNRDEWRQLTLAQRGLLVCIWQEYAAANGELRTSDLPSLILQKLPLNSLESLSHAGFIELAASKPLALARAGARSREEETETETPKPPLEKGVDSRPKKKRVHATGWREVRGSHGIDYIPDPFGTDRPPYSVPELREP